MSKASIDSTAVAITKELQFWTNDIKAAVIEATDEKAAKLIELLKETSPKRSKGEKAYAKNWRSKVQTNNFSYYRRKVYNKNKYQLTHLLEYGHAVRLTTGGEEKGRVEGIPHIKPARDKIQAEFEQAIMEAVKTSQEYGGGYYPAMSTDKK